MGEKRANVRGKVKQGSQMHEKRGEKEDGREKGECERKSGAGQSSAREKRRKIGWERKGRM
jgi:hypothetical protein